MTNRRLGDICFILSKNRLAGYKLIGKSALERELEAWINRPTIQIPIEHQPKEVAFKVPVRYEDEYPEHAVIMTRLFAANKTIRINLTRRLF